MRARILGSFVLAAALLGSTFVSAPDAQVQIQRGYGPSASAGSGGALMGLSGVLTVSTTSAQTGANTTETDLWTYSLPANTLSADNYGVRITVWGSLAANANVKNRRLYFGSTLAVGVGGSSAGSGGWRIVAEIYRTGASAQVASGIDVRASTAQATDPTTPAENTANAITIKITGQNGSASAGDIVFKGAMVEFLRAGS